MRIRKFNEDVKQSGKMKQFVVTTTSESSDHYIYFIEHPKKPTSKELKKFLVENGSDVDDGYCYENVDMCVEIKDFKKIKS